MEDVRGQLQTCKKENRDLENELRGEYTLYLKQSCSLKVVTFKVNANIEQRARLLEIKVVGNAQTMEQLREERALLAADHKDLQQRYTEISEVYFL